MLKLSNETKIGILAVVALGLAIWGFQFLKGINVLKTSKTYYVRYQNVDQLRPSAPVFINGFQVGMVKDMYVDSEDDRTIIAVLNIDRGVDFPPDTKATIVGLGLMGGRAIELKFDHPCNGDECAQSGTFLQGASQSLVQTLIGDPAQLDEYMARLRIGLTSIYDSIADPNDPQGFGKTLVALQASLQNIALLSHNLNRMVEANNASLATTTKNLAGISTAINAGNQDITQTLSNLAAISSQLKAARLDSSAIKASVAIDSVTASLSDLRVTLGGAQSAIAKVDTLAQHLVNGEGSAGKLLTDEELYDNLVRTSRHLQLLLQDLRLNPKRYNTVKVKVFGKNKTPDYDNPLDDPAYRLLIDSLERDYSRKLKQ
jgi:phospholipid/cholesterol/gamma-HCH transport system substrate-binding protein